MSALRKLEAFAKTMPAERQPELEREIEQLILRLQEPVVAELSKDWEAEITRRLHDPKRRLATDAEVKDAYAAFSRPRP